MDFKENAILILDNIRSAENVGAMFRTADAAGIHKIYLVGTTPAPIDRFGRARTDIAKAALGAEKFVSWSYARTALPVLTTLKKEKYTLIAIEQSAQAKDYKKIKWSGSVAFVVGNEVSGLSQKIVNQCDVVAQIPQRGKKESLNVSVALGIALFRILNI